MFTLAHESALESSGRDKCILATSQLMLDHRTSYAIQLKKLCVLSLEPQQEYVRQIFNLLVYLQKLIILWLGLKQMHVVFWNYLDWLFSRLYLLWDKQICVHCWQEHFSSTNNHVMRGKKKRMSSQHVTVHAIQQLGTVNDLTPE